MRRPDFRAVDPGQSRVVLIGTPHYRDENLPDVPVVANNVSGLAAVFTDPQLGGFAEQHCITVPPDADLVQAGEILTTAADQATDLLLVYYSGHGLIDRRGKLYLSLAETRPDQPAYSALAFDAVRETFLDGRARNRAVILDSCFSGRAIGQPLAGDEQPVLAAIEVSGTYTLTSATANRVALVLDGEQHTAFTERLLRLLRHGTPKAGQMLTLTDIYRHLRHQLAAEGLPEPQQRGTNAIELLGLVRNRQVGSARQLLATGALPMLASAAATGRPLDPGPAWQHSPGTVVSAEDRAVMAIEQALRLTSMAGSKQGRRLCLAAVAPVVAAIDEHQALSLAASVSDVERRESILKDVAVVIAASDFFRGIELVQNFWEGYRGEALAEIAQVAEKAHPGNGLYILDTYVLGGSPPRQWSPQTLSRIAGAVAQFAPGRAEAIAEAISDRYERVDALARTASAVAATDAARALRIIDRLVETEYSEWIGEGKYSGWMLSRVAQTVAVIDPDRALRLIAQSAGEQSYPYAMAGIARTIAHTDPARSLGIAEAITDRGRRAEALAAVACAVAATDLDQAMGIIAMIGDPEVEEAALADLLPVIATTDHEQAVHVTEQITHRIWRVFALAGIASVLLGIGHGRMKATPLAAK